MAERRPLVEGLKNVQSTADPEKEQDFVCGRKRPGAETSSTTTPAEPNRVALSTRIREDYVRALKRASLERQLEGVKPNAINEFLEQAIEPWLRANGYLP